MARKEDEARLKVLLADARKEYECDLLAVLKNDGRLIAATATSTADLEIFSIMCATILGASQTATKQLNREPPTRVLIDTADERLIIKELKPIHTLVAAVEKSRDIDAFEERLQKLSSRIEELDI